MANLKRKCKHCKEYVTEFVKVPAGVFCTFDHAIEFAQAKSKADAARQLAKANREQGIKDKSTRKQYRDDKERLKPLSKLKNEAQKSINSYIRIRDYHKSCISCGKSRELIEHEQGWKTGGSWDAGHYQGRGKKPQLRFVLYNIHKQCKSCNGGSGKYAHKAATVDQQYEINLIDKIGIDKVELLKNNQEIIKFEADYLRRIKTIFNKKTRIYKKFRAISA